MPIYLGVVSGENGQEFRVEVGPRDHDYREFTVPCIPLRCLVSRESRDAYPEVRYAVQAASRLDVCPQFLNSADEFDAVLDDTEMLGHARFVIDLWARQTA